MSSRCRHLRKMRKNLTSVDVHRRQPPATHMPQDRRLLRRHRRYVAQSRKVRRSDRRDHRHVRLRHPRQCVDLSRRARPDLHDQVIIRRFRRQQRQRNPDRVIEAPLRCPTHQLSCQHVVDHQLRRRLPVAARDADHRRPRRKRRPAVPPAQPSQRRNRVIHDDHPVARANARTLGAFTLHQTCRRPGTQRIRQKMMTVKSLPDDRNEQVPRTHRPRVRRNPADHHVLRPRPRSARRRRNISDLDRMHPRPPGCRPRPLLVSRPIQPAWRNPRASFRNSAATAASSN